MSRIGPGDIAGGAIRNDHLGPGQPQNVVLVYDVEVDGGDEGEYQMRDELTGAPYTFPPGAILTDVVGETVVTFDDDSAGAVISAGTTDNASEFVGPGALDSLVMDTEGWVGVISYAAAIKSDGELAPTFTVGTAPLVAGKIRLHVTLRPGLPAPVVT